MDENVMELLSRIASALEDIAKALQEWDYDFNVRLVNPPHYKPDKPAQET